eukprot:TRINITY_DN28078_c0_g1_i2.p1 TRINITY_DN28078_c0_g1~~TRINITY_DN28078_c0_g1_i2.p1  ORF type:complete len:428 (-),score=132.30 TRINITY_DN28078_c0_g1_i2:123-1406(-)
MLINTLRGMRPTDIGAAEVGVKETTQATTEYQHPDAPNIVLCDLPGISAQFPRETYAEFMRLDSFDFFLLISAGRFSEDDMFLASIIQKLGKPYFFVRTRIDLDITNHLDDYGTPEQETLRVIREDVTESIRKHNMDSRGFLISGRLANQHRYDFPELKTAVLESLPELKRNALAKHLSGYSKDIIDLKYEALKSEAWLYAATSACGAAIPVPGLSIAIDSGLIVTFAVYSMKTFRLEQSQLPRSFGREQSVNAAVMQIAKTAAQLCSTEYVIRTLVSFTASSVVEEVARYVPFIGQFIAGAISFKTTQYATGTILRKLRDVALLLARQVLETGGFGMIDSEELDAILESEAVSPALSPQAEQPQSAESPQYDVSTNEPTDLPEPSELHESTEDNSEDQGGLPALAVGLQMLARNRTPRTDVDAIDY